jgi:hypothetical protein
VIHREWLELAASEPAFPLDPHDRASLDAHLATCGGCSRAVGQLRQDAHQIRAFAVPGSLRLGNEVAGVLHRGDRARTMRRAIGLALLLAAVVSLSATIAFLAGAWPFRTYLVEWSTPVTTLRAEWLAIEANGRTFVPRTGVKVGGDPGTLEYWSIDGRWIEQGEGQRLLLEFAANGTHWWVTAIDTYDGTAHHDWVHFVREPAIGERLGVPWQGSVDLTARSEHGEVRLRIDGLQLTVSPQISYAAPSGGGRALPDDSDPLASGGPLAGTDILQLTPAAAHQQLLALGFRVSWRYSVNQYSYRCLNPPPGTIQEDLASVGSSGELILFVTPDGSPVPTIPDGCI